MELLNEIKFSHDYWVMLFPGILMVLDIITGYYNAWKKNEISSSKMRDGLGKKLAEIIYIVVGILISIVFGFKPLGYFISLYVIYMEMISIAENCKKLGMPLPVKIEEKLNNIGDELNNKGDDK